MYCFQQAQTLNPLCPDVYLHRGQINLLANNLDAAEKDLSEAMRLKPDFSVVQVCVHFWLPFIPFPFPVGSVVISTLSQEC